MNNIICIYKITSNIGGVYIGQTSDYRKRYSQYVRLKCKDQRLIYESLQKYGVENHNFEIIHIVDAGSIDKGKIRDELNNLEAYYVKLFDSYVGNNPEFGLNLTTGGGGCELSEETKLKISNSIKLLMSNDSIRDSISKKLKGKILSNETKERISEALKGKYVGEKHWNTGKKSPDGFMEKMLKDRMEKYEKEGNPLVGRKYSEEHRKNISISKLGKESKIKGRKLSEEHKLKIGLANKGKLTGRKMPEEVKLKISNSNKGKPKQKKL